jgi:iron complex transport system substrate-binding protein
MKTALALLFLTAAAPALAQDFPLTLDTAFGPVTIEAQPERVATLDYAGADNVLALGFQPLTVRRWFAPYENELWPWAQGLAAARPVVLEGDLDFEAIAATDPDVILAFRSGITAEDFARLKAIAPTVAIPPGATDFSLDWIEQAQRAGLALGKSDEAAAQIAAIQAQLAETAAAHPDWQGKTFAMLTWWNGTVGLYTPGDSSVKFIEDLGLTIHPGVVAHAKPDTYYVEISQEVLPELDADVIFWWAPADSPEIAAIVARQSMRAVAEGREVFLPQTSEANGALANGSLLSLPVAIRLIAERIEAAVDGDPATPVPQD